MINDLTPTQRDLAELMSDLSENAWRAGWMQGLEYELWSAIKSPEVGGNNVVVRQGRSTVMDAVPSPYRNSIQSPA